MRPSTAGRDCKVVVVDNVDDITWLLLRAQLMAHHMKLFLPPAKLLSAAKTFTFFCVLIVITSLGKILSLSFVLLLKFQLLSPVLGFL